MNKKQTIHNNSLTITIIKCKTLDKPNDKRNEYINKI